MKPTKLTALLPVLLLGLTGCSTIITGGRKEVNFRSSPPGARIAIADEKGIAIYEGHTPTVVTLKTGKPYFVPKRYSVQVTKEGYQPVNSELKGTVSGWYAGNFVFGGLLGLLVIDPLTGAMYTLPKEKEFELQPNGSSDTTTALPASGHRVTGYSSALVDGSTKLSQTH